MANLKPTSECPIDNKYIEKSYMTTHRLENFTEIPEDNIEKLFKSAPSKSCELGPLPASLMKTHGHVLIPILVDIINQSLQQGKFAQDLKEALIHPLLKKANLDLIYSDYRPVSNLSFLSKLMEWAVYQQLGNYMAITNMSEKLQSAYKVAHSTETALIKVKNDILMSLDNKQVTCLILLDLSAAFDTVSHKLLLNHLKFHFGITGVVLKWLEEYLTGRHQWVVLGESADQVMSEKVTLKQGVPQSSILGPILFTLYTSPLGDICRSHNVMFHSYADDQQNYMSFSPASQDSKDHCIQTLQSCISDIHTWMRTNLLKLNDNKTEIVLLGTRQQLGKVGQFEIKIGQDNISPAPTARNLGVFFDQEMKWTSHINMLSASLFVTICSIAHIQHQLNKETAKIIIQALVLSKLDYCNSVYHGAPKYSIAKLQRLQNMSARVVSNVKYCNHIPPISLTYID